MKTPYAEQHGFRVDDAEFAKSSYTSRGGIITRCVRVARTPNGVAIRDSKDSADADGKTTLFFRNDEWDAFIQGVKAGEFDV